ncbi:hypothetical protein SAMN05216548_1289 [Faunimonas pinastri]|uniref:Uncharacterized protein n=1 Tax=Faunimonas pinastri TaxID=1855383 RepID=A0A1H9QFT9_9HYPH|nr:hypothetical protein [Faunimonas pinastri]SER59421.1 hypothetical protein SAMN05216548_1289 [Faunimonas pinastri]
MAGGRIGVNHAEAQRRYRARLRERQAPELDSVARAVLQGVRRLLADGQVTEADAGALRTIVGEASQSLVENGFDRKEASRRLLRALAPGPEALIERDALPEVR